MGDLLADAGIDKKLSSRAQNASSLRRFLSGESAAVGWHPTINSN
jgi:hypothetical protein